MSIRRFMETHLLHFDARETLAAAKAWRELTDSGGKMLLSMAGAMSTAELGISLARMIRAGQVSAVVTTGANLEEDVFNLFAHDDYVVVPNWRDMTPEDEVARYDRGLNRVTDTCIPETVLRHIEERVVALWRAASEKGERHFPYEYLMTVLADRSLEQRYHVPRENSWLLAAMEMNVPIWTPGWEDSTLGNIFTAACRRGKETGVRHQVMNSGTEQMESLAAWYQARAAASEPIGFFQIGGGIAGDFPICVVPMLIEDLKLGDTPFWAYFAQIGDSTTSYGSYSGAVPREKITWGEIDARTPSFMINSDATIVAPLIFAYVLDE